MNSHTCMRTAHNWPPHSHSLNSYYRFYGVAHTHTSNCYKNLIVNLFSQRTNWPLSPCHSVMYCFVRYAVTLTHTHVLGWVCGVCVCASDRLYRNSKSRQAKIKMFNYQQFQRSVQFECSSRIDWETKIQNITFIFTPLCVWFLYFPFPSKILKFGKKIEI